MSADTLSDLLRAVRLRGALFFYLEGSAPWIFEAPPSRSILPAVLPGVEHMMEFHAVARGSCWAGVVGGEPLRLEEGDFILFPQGDGHVVSSTPGLRSPGCDADFFFGPRPPRLPFALHMTEQGVTTARLEGGGPEEARLVCGFLGFDAQPFNPLLASLPRVLHLAGLASGSSWIAHFLDAVVEESSRRRPGGEAVLERMSEMLFVEALRRYADELAVEDTGWLAAQRDPIVGRALSRLHERPAEAWTLERLAASAAASRTTLAERFGLLVGQPPMQYLNRWRMQLAAARLRDTDAKVAGIAREIGYANEAAFSRAFRRAVGVSPSAWRRMRRTVAAGDQVPTTIPSTTRS